MHTVRSHFAEGCGHTCKGTDCSNEVITPIQPHNLKLLPSVFLPSLLPPLSFPPSPSLLPFPPCLPLSPRPPSSPPLPALWAASAHPLPSLWVETGSRHQLAPPVPVMSSLSKSPLGTGRARGQVPTVFISLSFFLVLGLFSSLLRCSGCEELTAKVPAPAVPTRPRFPSL